MTTRRLVGGVVMCVLGVVFLAGCALVRGNRMPLIWTWPGGEPAQQQWTGEVKGPALVVDGGTLVVAGRTIRLWGIAALELTRQCDSATGPVPCGVMALDGLTRLIDGRPVECKIRDIDDKGRLVAVCRAGRADIGAVMVRSGLALALTTHGADADNGYANEEAAARADRVGIWAFEER